MPQNLLPFQQQAVAAELLQQQGLPPSAENMSRAMEALGRNPELSYSAEIGKSYYSQANADPASPITTRGGGTRIGATPPEFLGSVPGFGPPEATSITPNASTAIGVGSPLPGQSQPVQNPVQAIPGLTTPQPSQFDAATAPIDPFSNGGTPEQGDVGGDAGVGAAANQPPSPTTLPDGTRVDSPPQEDSGIGVLEGVLGAGAAGAAVTALLHYIRNRGPNNSAAKGPAAERLALADERPQPLLLTGPEQSAAPGPQRALSAPESDPLSAASFDDFMRRKSAQGNFVDDMTELSTQNAINFEEGSATDVPPRPAPEASVSKIGDNYFLNIGGQEVPALPMYHPDAGSVRFTDGSLNNSLYIDGTVYDLEGRKLPISREMRADIQAGLKMLEQDRRAKLGLPSSPEEFESLAQKGRAYMRGTTVRPGAANVDSVAKAISNAARSR